ncbi:MAG: hypothetical protein FJ255_09425 [Phycisphaerae bacterium]|nr:hypothetical protein [Phycisphaerae bacterium]
MHQDLLAPPKLTVRTYAKFVSGLSVLAVVMGVAMAAAGSLTLGELAGKAALIALLATAAVLAYAGLMRVARRARPERMPLIHAAVSATGMIAMFAVFGLLLRGTTAWSGQPFTWMIPVMVGVTLAMGGWGRRVGESMHCPKCEYEFWFDVGAAAPDRCPECGLAWLGKLRKGRRVRSPRLVAAGVALALGGTLVLNQGFYLGALAPHLPTPVLYASLYVSPQSTCSSWDELAKRALSPGWTRTMGERVLRARGNTPFDYGPSRWFEAMAAAGSIPPDLSGRFYREGIRAELRVPGRVKAGEAFTAQLRMTRAAWGSALMFAGYAVGDEEALLGRHPELVWAHELGPGGFLRHRDVLAHTLRADHRGATRVRAVYWVVYQPSFWDDSAWRPDGTPVAPSGATWFERVELEKTVRVE